MRHAARPHAKPAGGDAGPPRPQASPRPGTAARRLPGRGGGRPGRLTIPPLRVLGIRPTAWDVGSKHILRRNVAARVPLPFPRLGALA